MWIAALVLLGDTPGTASEVCDAEQMATSPMFMGELVLRSAGRLKQSLTWWWRGRAVKALKKDVVSGGSQVGQILSEETDGGGGG